MPSSCIFELNKPQAIYFGGETISGTIILNTSSEKNVRGMLLEILVILIKVDHHEGGRVNY